MYKMIIPSCCMHTSDLLGVTQIKMYKLNYKWHTKESYGNKSTAINDEKHNPACHFA